MPCTTHHHACECREAMFAEKDAEIERLRAELAECWDKCKRGEHPWQAGPTYTRCTDPRACRRKSG